MIKENYEHILKQIPENVTLVAVSKTHPAEKVQACYDLGQRIFGENKVQELVEKQPLLPADIQWHLIGHLQTNKVKYIAEFVDTIQSVDSEKVLKEINKQAKNYNRKIKVLLQIKIAKEESKFGLTPTEAKKIVTDWLEGEYPHILINGVMGMATFTNDEVEIKKEFLQLKKHFDELNSMKAINTISMGMSGDFPLAIECGSNSVRIGSAIFGTRNYQN